MRYLLFLLSTIIELELIQCILKYINNNEEEEKNKILVSRKHKIVIVTIIGISNLSLSILNYNSSIEYVFATILIAYLVLSAYIDQMKMIVYSFLNKGIFIIFIVFMIINIYKGMNFKIYLYSFLSSLLISYFLFKVRCFGEGDAEIIVAISLFMANKYIIGWNLSYSILNLLLAFFLSALVNLFTILFRRKNIQKKKAFAPYIMTASLISIIFI